MIREFGLSIKFRRSGGGKKMKKGSSEASDEQKTGKNGSSEASDEQKTRKIGLPRSRTSRK